MSAVAGMAIRWRGLHFIFGSVFVAAALALDMHQALVYIAGALSIVLFDAAEKRDAGEKRRVEVE